jgi:type IV secretion system protein VirB2
MLNDPLGPSALVVAVRWLEITLLGTIATTTAVICVAWIGVTMLTGRIQVRHCMTTILGCFVLFGASSIAAGIQCAAHGECAVADDSVQSRADIAPLAAPPPPIIIPPRSDPYAGAAIRRH